MKVLLIDDESDYSDTMSFYLKAKGYSVRTADSGMAGLEEIRKEAPEIIFLDFLMPQMDGVETLKKIREISTTVPVIMVTSYATEALMEKAKSLGISAIFPKAEDFSIAARLIREVLEKRS